MVLFNPEAYYTVGKSLCIDAFMIEIIPDIKRMPCHLVEPGVICCRLVVAGIQPNQGALPESMIQCDIQNDGDAFLMRFIHKVFQVIPGTVEFIRSEKITWIISPAEVAFKLHDGHELNGIDAETFQVRKTVGQIAVLAGADKIA